MITYSLTWLSSLSEDKLRDILVGEFGESDFRVRHKDKMELIEMICDAQDEAEKNRCGDCDGCDGDCDGDCDGPDNCGGSGGCSGSAPKNRRWH